MNDVCRDSYPQAKHRETGHAEIVAPEKKIRRKHLINKLNHHNFCDKPVLLVFSSQEYAQTFEHEGYVSPCCESEVSIRIPSIDTPRSLLDLTLEYVQFKTSTGLYRFYSSYFHIAGNGIAVEIPSFGEQLFATTTAYIPAKDCCARVFQNAVEMHGHIERFSSQAFIFVCDSQDNSHQLINADSDAHVLIQNQDGHRR